MRRRKFRQAFGVHGIEFFFSCQLLFFFFFFPGSISLHFHPLTLFASNTSLRRSIPSSGSQIESMQSLLRTKNTFASSNFDTCIVESHQDWYVLCQYVNNESNLRCIRYLLRHRFLSNRSHRNSDSFVIISS